MDFTLTDDQELLRSTARNLLARECPTKLVRAHIDDRSAADPLWEHLRHWTAVAEGPLTDLCLFLEETGAVLAPGPFLPTVALLAPLLAALGDELLPAALAGDVTGTVAMAGRNGVWVPNSEPVKTFVPEGDRVDVVAIVGGDRNQPSVTLARGLPGRPVPTIDTSRRLAELDAGAAREPAIAVEPEVVSALLQRAYVTVAAELLGTTRWLFDTTLAYASARRQFGRPIGSFQAVQHKLANMALVRERAWSAVYYAAMTIDAADPDRRRAAHVAKAAAGEAARLNAKDAIQIHGGIGYTWEHDLHLFIRRAYASEHLLGTSGWHHDRLGELLVDA
ncbi:MAG TPA: acyl-CoA dehydrogenase family protein [Acidimicrobiales bacterium]|nr:acyl-CoA dehydrogenase family protein [Acidimicrobiales bacterium]